MQDPAGGPNFWGFDPAVKYDIKVDNDGDGYPDVTYSFRFTTHIRNKGTFLSNTGVATSRTDTDINVYQTYDLTKQVEGGSPQVILNDAYTAPTNVGPRATPDYERHRRRRGPHACRPGSRSSPASATIRSSSTWAPSSIWAGCARSTASMPSRSSRLRASTTCRAPTC